MGHSIFMAYLKTFSAMSSTTSFTGHWKILKTTHLSTILTEFFWSDLCDTTTWSFSYKTCLYVVISISPFLLNIDGAASTNSRFKTVSKIVSPVAKNPIIRPYPFQHPFMCCAVGLPCTNRAKILSDRFFILFM